MLIWLGSGAGAGTGCSTVEMFWRLLGSAASVGGGARSAAAGSSTHQH